MTITALLMAGLLAFVLLVPTLMVAVLVSGVARRTPITETETAGSSVPTDSGTAPPARPVAA